MPRVQSAYGQRGAREDDIGHAIELSRRLGMFIKKPGADCKQFTVLRSNEPLFQAGTVRQVVSWLRQVSTIGRTRWR